jgi:hypothetical protein
MPSLNKQLASLHKQLNDSCEKVFLVFVQLLINLIVYETYIDVVNKTILSGEELKLMPLTFFENRILELNMFKVKSSLMEGWEQSDPHIKEFDNILDTLDRMMSYLPLLHYTANRLKTAITRGFDDF